VSRATVANTACRALLGYCERRGLETATLLAASGMPRRMIDDPHARVRALHAERLWLEAERASRDPSLGLHVGEGVAFGSYPVFNYLAAGAATVGAGLTRATSYFPLIHSAIELRVREHSRDVEIAMVCLDPGLSLVRPYVEYVLSTLVLHSRFATGLLWIPHKVEFTFRRTERSREHERVFGCPVSFGRTVNRLLVDRATWNLATRLPMPGLLELVEAQAQAEVKRHRSVQRSLLDQVRAELSLEMKGKEPRVAVVAKRLSTTARTLQRRLKQHGTSFSKLVDETRRKLAQMHLKADDLSLAELAFLLGFSEQSALTRAFKRWFGGSPSAVRARHRQAAQRRSARTSPRRAR